VTPDERRLNAQIAAHTRWAHEPDRTAATAPARRALDEKFETLVDPDRKLDPVLRARMAASARSAHYRRLAKRSAEVRRARRDGAA
jgi:hypothetical protein